MSSDSEDNDYSNVVKRLKKIKRRYPKPKVDMTSHELVMKIQKEIESQSGTSRNSETTKEISLDEIIANHRKDLNLSKTLDTQTTIQPNEPELPSMFDYIDNSTLDTSQANTTRGRGRGRGRGRQIPRRGGRSRRGARAAQQSPMAYGIDPLYDINTTATSSNSLNLSKMLDIQTNTQPNEPELPSMFDYIHKSTLDTSQANTTRGRGRGRGRGRQSPRRGGRGRRGARAAQQSPMAYGIDPLYGIDTMATSSNSLNLSEMLEDSLEAELPSVIIPGCGRGRQSQPRGGRGRQGARAAQQSPMAYGIDPLYGIDTTATSSNSLNLSEMLEDSLEAELPSIIISDRERGRQSPPRGGRRRQGARAAQQSPMAYGIDPLNDINTTAMSSNSQSYPTYSVGNTDEYPDKSECQPLFSSKPKPKPQNDQDLDDDDEISVKVFWQSSDYVKFNLRPFQLLTPIFNHFAKQEKCSPDNLLFTYNGKILKSGDTPHSINYNFVKFIDGGVVNLSVSSLLQGRVEDGIKLKFQCKNVKKPFFANIRPDWKMLVVMMKCAEHLQKPLDKLKFYFDGDLISDSATPRELDLVEGECIDVNIISD